MFDWLTKTKMEYTFFDDVSQGICVLAFCGLIWLVFYIVCKIEKRK